MVDLGQIRVVVGVSVDIICVYIVSRYANVFRMIYLVCGDVVSNVACRRSPWFLYLSIFAQKKDRKPPVTSLDMRALNWII